ncbi:MAG: TRAP transporter substrate-binding protein DctP [Proteobacteria bacterium]|nr:TRAP transporter substrate-binding protein DctP [Pseudomonadota bacterium]
MNNLKLTAAGIATGAMMALTAMPSHAATTWTCNIFSGPKHFINVDTKIWGKDVAEVTKGEVNARFLPANAAPPPKQIDAITAGTFDCALIFHGFTAKRAVGPQFAILPFLNAGNAEAGGVAFWRTWQKHFAAKKEFEKKGIKILSQYQFPGVHFFTSEPEPINSLADMKGMKMWALAGTSSRTMKEAGVNHVSGPAARMAEFTQTKVVQGLAGTPRAGIVNYAGVQFPKWGTFTKGSIMSPSFAWMVSKRKWDALTAEQRKAIMSVSGEKMARGVGRTADKFEITSAEKLAKAGVKETKASAAFEAELQKAGAPQVKAWIKRAATIGVDGAQVIADYKKIVSDLGS